jgi:hypothetical protein
MYGNDGKNIINNRNCPYDGEHDDDNGKQIECSCDECDYLIDCWNNWKNISETDTGSD